jgi:hypothetical protein
LIFNVFKENPDNFPFAEKNEWSLQSQIHDTANSDFYATAADGKLQGANSRIGHPREVSHKVVSLGADTLTVAAAADLFNGLDHFVYLALSQKPAMLSHPNFSLPGDPTLT